MISNEFDIEYNVTTTVTDLNAVASEVSKLKLRLDQAQLSYRDAALKSRREIVILKRLISRLSAACRGLDHELDQKLIALRQELEQNQDISKILPRLAVVERLVSRLANFAERENQDLSRHISRSSEVLHQMHSLPAQLKRELTQALSQPGESLSQTHQQVYRLLAFYERAVKLLSTQESDASQTAVDLDVQLKLTHDLQHLITELDFDGEAGDKLQTIRNRLLTGVTPSALLEIVLDILRLVLDGTHQERRASQQFLDNVHGELATLQKTTQQSAEQSQTIYEHRSGMTTELADLAQQIRTGLKERQSLDSWRPELTAMTKELLILAERNRALEKREQALLEQLHYNESKIISLYEQTQDYRKRLQDQEQRMFLDNLTRVYNQAAFHDRLNHEYQRWLRNQHPLCVALVDIDEFKKINTSFGHAAGDKILKIIARAIRQQLSPTDFIARFSDDAFMLILPETDEETRNKRLGCIREAIVKLPFRFRDKNVTISVSIGATLFEANDTPPDIIERTEKALISARSAGNNRILWIA